MIDLWHTFGWSVTRFGPDSLATHLSRISPPGARPPGGVGMPVTHLSWDSAYRVSCVTVDGRGRRLRGGVSRQWPGGVRGMTSPALARREGA